MSGDDGKPPLKDKGDYEVDNDWKVCIGIRGETCFPKLRA